MQVAGSRLAVHPAPEGLDQHLPVHQPATVDRQQPQELEGAGLERREVERPPVDGQLEATEAPHLPGDRTPRPPGHGQSPGRCLRRQPEPGFQAHCPYGRPFVRLPLLTMIRQSQVGEDQRPADPGGAGEHLGVWPADHFHAVNHRFVLEIKRPTGNIVPFWMKAIERVTANL